MLTRTLYGNATILEAAGAAVAAFGMVVIVRLLIFFYGQRVRARDAGREDVSFEDRAVTRETIKLASAPIRDAWFLLGFEASIFVLRVLACLAPNPGHGPQVPPNASPNVQRFIAACLSLVPDRSQQLAVTGGLVLLVFAGAILWMALLKQRDNTWLEVREVLHPDEADASTDPDAHNDAR